VKPKKSTHTARNKGTDFAFSIGDPTQSPATTSIQFCKQAYTILAYLSMWSKASFFGSSLKF